MGNISKKMHVTKCYGTTAFWLELDKETYSTRQEKLLPQASGVVELLQRFTRNRDMPFNTVRVCSTHTKEMRAAFEKIAELPMQQVMEHPFLKMFSNEVTVSLVSPYTFSLTIHADEHKAGYDATKANKRHTPLKRRFITGNNDGEGIPVFLSEEVLHTVTSTDLRAFPGLVSSLQTLNNSKDTCSGVYITTTKDKLDAFLLRRNKALVKETDEFLFRLLVRSPRLHNLLSQRMAASGQKSFTMVADKLGSGGVVVSIK